MLLRTREPQHEMCKEKKLSTSWQVQPHMLKTSNSLVKQQSTNCSVLYCRISFFCPLLPELHKDKAN